MTEQEFQRYQTAVEIKEEIKQCELNIKELSEVYGGNFIIQVKTDPELPWSTLRLSENAKNGLQSAVCGFFITRISELKEQFEEL